MTTTLRTQADRWLAGALALALGSTLLLGTPRAVHAEDALAKAADAAAAEARTGDAKTSETKTSETKASDTKASDTRSADTKAAGAQGVLALLPADAVTSHTLTINGRALAYTATAGTFPLYGQTGERTAAVFYTSYVAKDAPANRPITFVFNGGPGAASAYLHLGLVGPKVLDFGPSGRDGSHAALVDNPQSWLAFTDLVIIDPVGTGWSRTTKADDSSFFGVQPDAQAMAKVIALYLARNGRSGAPKYLLGESYGGFRAAKTAQALRQSQGVIVAGVIMLSPLIDGSLIFGSNRYPLGAALQLPSLTATELERRGAFTPQAQADAERFAMTDYLTTLAGAAPTGDAAHAFYGRVAALSGLSPELVTRTRGFVRDAFLKHLRERDQSVVSIYDAALAAPDPYPDSDGRGPDPVLEGFTRAYGGAFAAYARETLGFKTDMTYQLLSMEVNNKWKWGDGDGSRRQANASDDIRELLALDPSFRLMVAHGYSDLITPYGVSRYVLDHLPRELAEGRTSLKLYRGGHMLYTIPASRAALTADAKAFYDADGRKD